MNPSPVRVGQLRPSQLLWAFGVGSLVDLPRTSMVVLGLDEWDSERCVPLSEARLLEGVRMKLGPQVKDLKAPPIPPETRRFDPWSEAARIGVPVAPFPAWLRCPFCNLIAPWQSGLFELEADPYRIDRTVFRHENCAKANRPIAVPTRFLVACRDGHLDDFPWSWFVHRGPSECTGRLEFFEVGASLETRNLWVKCVECDVKPRTMADAFGEKGKEALPACRGRHPHLRYATETCSRDLRAVLLGASNSWFPITMSVLSIPTEAGRISQLVADLWQHFEDVESLAELAVVLRVLKKEGRLPGIREEAEEAIWQEIESLRGKGSGDESEAEPEPDFKTPEWAVFTRPDPPKVHPDFLVSRGSPPEGFEKHITRVVLAERLREVNALIGFTRVDPPDEGGQEEEAPQRAPLSRSRPSWVPATEVRGEGLFLQFDQAKVEAWLGRSAVLERAELILQGHRFWRAARGLQGLDDWFPGALFVMLHTFSHVLLRELALECGYGASSIRERVYAASPGGSEMAGLLLYTAAPDSDGTLGGLVSLGEPEMLGRLIGQGLERARICSADPLCAEHVPAGDRSLHGAACHACAFASETSCETGNRYLDRSLIVDTVGAGGAGFFDTP